MKNVNIYKTTKTSEMTMRDITEEIAEFIGIVGKSNKKHHRSTPDIVDSSLVNFPTVTKEDLIKELGHHWKSNIKKLIPLVDIYDHVTSNKYYNVIVCPVKGDLATVYGSVMNASNILKKARKIHLIDYAPDRKKWYSMTAHKAYQYIWNKDVQNLIKQIAKENKIISRWKQKKCCKGIVQKIQEERESINTSDIYDKVRFGKCSAIADDEHILATLFQKYPAFDRLVTVTDEINNKLPMDLRQRCEPSIHRSQSGRVTSIGIRSTNFFTTLKKDVDFDDPRSRDAYLTRHFKNGYKKYDVKASVPTLTRLINKGVWLDDVDAYSTMFNDGKPFKLEDKEYRNNLKMAFMLLYFGDSNKLIYRNLHNREAFSFEQFSETQIRDGINANIKKMEDDIGPSLGSEIFLYESLCYANVYNCLLDLSKKHNCSVPLQCYDCFYIDSKLAKILEEEFTSIKSIVKEITTATIDTLGYFQQKYSTRSPIKDETNLFSQIRDICIKHEVPISEKVWLKGIANRKFVAKTSGKAVVIGCEYTGDAKHFIKATINAFCQMIPLNERKHWRKEMKSHIRWH